MKNRHRVLAWLLTLLFVCGAVLQGGPPPQANGRAGEENSPALQPQERSPRRFPSRSNPAASRRASCRLPTWSMPVPNPANAFPITFSPKPRPIRHSRRATSSPRANWRSDGVVLRFRSIIAAGEGDFTLLDKERENLRRFVERGGMLLASADATRLPEVGPLAFRREMALIFRDEKLTALGMECLSSAPCRHVATLKAKHGDPKPLEGVSLAGRVSFIRRTD